MVSSALLFTCLVLSSTCMLVWAVKVDMGTCSCNCGPQLPRSPTLSSIFMGGSTGGKFYQSIRGQKGDMGRPGEVGAEGPPGTVGESGARGPPAVVDSKNAIQSRVKESCVDLLVNGATSSGVYSIKPRGSLREMQVYCDMTSAGGGWTLVASIHENNIDGKCTLGDNWSSDQGVANNNFTSKVSTSWENFKTFGSPEAATSSDYKSSAYFGVQGADVMVAHIPNDSEMDQWDSRTFLKYHTTNNFLTAYGGSLRTLFSKYFPLSSGRTKKSSMDVLRQMAIDFRRNEASFVALVPGFYRYNYDGGPLQSYISDGGNDMYDTGNRVFYRVGNQPYQSIRYEKEYIDYSVGVQVYSLMTHPFITFMWITNLDGSVDNFGLKVTSGTGADNNGLHSSDHGVVTNGNMTCEYNAYHVYGAGSDPSICEVYFYCSNPVDWSSVAPSRFSRTEWSSTTDGLANAVDTYGAPRNILMGYTLLSRASSVKVSAIQINAVIQRMMVGMAAVPQVPTLDCSRLNDSLVVPVVYDVGSGENVLSGVAQEMKRNVVPGFLHFRVLDPYGNPNALCPGLKSLTCSPQRVCVGGIGVGQNVTDVQRQSCGDFSGWSKGDTNATRTSPDSAHDINTSILIFTK